MTAPAPQQTPVVRSVHRATGSQEVATITTPAETAVGDVLLAFHAADWDTAAELLAPTPAGSGTKGTWNQRAVADRGTNATHLKVWTREVTTRGSQRVSVGYADDCDICLVVVVLDGSTVDPAWFDVATQATGVASRTHAAGSVTPTGTADLLLTAHATSDSVNSNKAVAVYTSPPGMTSALRQGSNPVGADSISSDEWVSLGVFTEARTAGGATGARTATCSVSRPFAAVTIAIRGAILPVPLILDSGPPAILRHHATAGHEFVATGYTYDGDASSVHHRGQPADLARELEGPVVLVRHHLGPSDLERQLPSEPVRGRHRAFEGVLDNLTATPSRVRHSGKNGLIEYQAVTALTEQRPLTVTRPRNPVRYYAQNVLDRQWRSKSLGLLDDRITTRVNGACEIAGRIAATELRDIGIGDSDLWIHAEVDGSIRGSGMLTEKDFAWGGPEIDIAAHGITAYPHGERWEADWTLRGDTGIVGVGLDPLDVMRAIWAHLQSYPDGRLGVVLSPVKSTVRIGEPEKQTVTAVDSSSTAAGTTGGVTTSGTTTTSAPKAATPSVTTPNTATTPATGTANATTDTAEQTTGPYILKWWEDTDLGKILDDLAKSTPFDYRELPYWSDAQKSDVVQYVEYGFPRVGRDLSADGLVFAEHENLTIAFAPVEHDDDASGYVTVLGKGEGTARIRGTYGVRKPGRVRRTTLVEKKDCSTTAMANAYARAEWPRRQGFISFDEVHLKPEHKNAPYGSFRCGDDIPCRARVEGLGPVFLRHRVMELTYEPKKGSLVAKTQRSDTFSYGSSAATP